MGSSSFFELFGSLSFLVAILWIVYKILKGLWTCFIGSALGFGAKWRPGPDTWAVITGATDGIGLAYAKEFARMGYCIFMVSRNKDKLEKTMEEIQTEYPKCPNIRYVAADFSQEDCFDIIEKELTNIPDIHVLVNNVGISYEYPEYFTKIPNRKELIGNITRCNMISVMRMTELILPRMENRRTGIIINLSSYSASYPMPLLTMYAASKTFVDYFSRALHVEYSGKGIIIQSVLPAYVATKMSKIRRASVMVPTPKTYVQHALKTVGIETRTYGYWAHKLQGFIQDCIIAHTVGPDFNVKLAYDTLLDVRRRYYKKEGIKAD